VEIRNVGPNTAKRPGCWIVACGKLLRAEYMGDGFLEPGAAIDIVTPIVGPADDGDVAAMFWCRDHEEMLHAWTHRGQHRVFRPRRRQEPWEVSVKYADMWSGLFPDVPQGGLIDLVGSPARWAKRRPTAHAPLNFDDVRMSAVPPDTTARAVARRLRRAFRAGRRSWDSPDELPPRPPSDA
jgi:hypothetical protein